MWAGMLFFAFTMFRDKAGLFASLGRSFGAIASITEDAAALTARVAESGANISVRVASKFVKILDSSLTATEEFCVGVDLLNVTAERKVVRVASDSTASLTFWLEQGAGGVLPRDVRLDAAEAAWNLSEAVPLPHALHEKFDVRGRLVMWELKAKVLASGYRAAVVQCTIITFSPQWANVLWSMLELDWSKQNTMILHRTKEFRDALRPMPAHLLELSDAALETGTLPVIEQVPPAWLRRMGIRSPRVAVAVAWTALAVAITLMLWPQEPSEDAPSEDFENWQDVSSPSDEPPSDDASSVFHCIENWDGISEFDQGFQAPWLAEASTESFITPSKARESRRDSPRGKGSKRRIFY